MSIYRDIKEEVKEENKRNSFEGIIAFLIDDEIEAIDGYEESKQKLIGDERYENAIKVFDHIIAEEKEHIEELKELL